LHRCANKQEFKHEIIQGIQEQTPVRGDDGGRLKVRTELLLASGEVSWGETSVLSGLQFFEESSGSYIVNKQIKNLIKGILDQIMKKLTFYLPPSF
jgi:hypothetical protein